MKLVVIKWLNAIPLAILAMNGVFFSTVLHDSKSFNVPLAVSWVLIPLCVLLFIIIPCIWGWMILKKNNSNSIDHILFSVIMCFCQSVIILATWCYILRLLLPMGNA